MSGKKSRSKGQRGEREAAKKLNQLLGLDNVFIRGQQFCGLYGAADVAVDPANDSQVAKLLNQSLHVECKYVEKFSLYPSIEQADRDKGPGKLPLVLHRRNGKPWTVVVYLEHLPDLARLLGCVERMGAD